MAAGVVHTRGPMFEWDSSSRLLASRYWLGPELARGGTAAVYRGTRLADGHPVAIKLLHSHLVQQEMLARFAHEARTIASIDHPNVVRILELDLAHRFIAMELAEGETLARVIRRGGALSPRRVVRLAIEVLAALDAIHTAGVVHCDLKPGNIVVSRDASGAGTKVLDFGIAQILGRGTGVTWNGGLIGTPAYMAPEQMLDGAVDARTDLYALGVVMYGALSGRKPFESQDLGELLSRVLVDAAPPLTDLCPGLDPTIAAIVHRALSKSPDDRYVSANEMLAALWPFMSLRDSAPPMVPIGQRDAGQEIDTQLA